MAIGAQRGPEAAGKFWSKALQASVSRSTPSSTWGGSAGGRNAGVGRGRAAWGGAPALPASASVCCSGTLLWSAPTLKPPVRANPNEVLPMPAKQSMTPRPLAARQAAGRSTAGRERARETWWHQKLERPKGEQYAGKTAGARTRGLQARVARRAAGARHVLEPQLARHPLLIVPERQRACGGMAITNTSLGGCFWSCPSRPSGSQGQQPGALQAGGQGGATGWYRPAHLRLPGTDPQYHTAPPPPPGEAACTATARSTAGAQRAPASPSRLGCCRWAAAGLRQKCMQHAHVQRALMLWAGLEASNTKCRSSAAALHGAHNTT